MAWADAVNRKKRPADSDHFPVDDGSGKNTLFEDIRKGAGTFAVASISELIGLETARFKAGDRVTVEGFYAGAGGGSQFFWYPNEDRANHNGITIIDPTKTSTIGSQFWYTDSNTSTGCWKRKFDGKLTAKESGAREGDNTFDNRFAFVKALEIINDNGGGEFYFDGTYYFNSGGSKIMDIYSNTTIRGSGLGSAKLVVGDSVSEGTAVILGAGVRDIEFKSFQIDGNKQRLASGDIGVYEDEGIDLKGPINAVFENIYIHDMATDAIDIDNGGGFASPKNVSISKCFLIDNGGVGIHNGVPNSKVNLCWAINNGHERNANNTGQVALDACGIDMKAGSSEISNCLINDNVRGTNIAHGKCRITNCSIENNTEIQVVVGSVSSIRPFNIIIDSCTIVGEGIHAKQVDRLSLSGNTINASNGRGVMLDDVKGFTISGGVIRGYLSGDETSVQGTGVQLFNDNGFEWTISGVTFQWMTYGVKCEDSNTTTGLVTGCSFMRDGVAGVDMRGGASGVSVLNNKFQESGPRVLSGTNNIIMNNVTPAIDDGGGTGSIIKNNVINGTFVADGTS